MFSNVNAEHSDVINKLQQRIQQMLRVRLTVSPDYDITHSMLNNDKHLSTDLSTIT